jgi:hypothetical protein
MISMKNASRKTRRPEAPKVYPWGKDGPSAQSDEAKCIGTTLDDAALDRIVKSVSTLPKNLDREQLRSDIETLPSWYATHETMRASVPRRRRDLQKILTIAKRLKDQLSGDVWPLVLNRLSIDDVNPQQALTSLIDIVTSILSEAPNRQTKFAEKFKSESSLAFIAGKRLPSIFERNFKITPKRSRTNGKPDGPCVRFIRQTMTELRMPYEGESIIRAMSRAKHTSQPALGEN